MKKIIDRPSEVRCDKCGVLYSFEQEDIIAHKSNIGFDGLFVECPACKEFNLLVVCERSTHHE